MKNSIINRKYFLILFTAISGLYFLASCNKPLPAATPIEYPSVNNSETSIGQMISTDTSYSFFAAAAAKTGQLAQLNADSTEFTVFLPTNNAFRVSGIPSIDALNTLPIQSLGGIVGYAIIPGKQYLSADITTGGITPTKPNDQLPTSITIGQLPGTSLPFKLTTFPSVSGGAFYDNTIPVTKPDIKLKNGVIHEVAAIVAPPSMVLKDMMDRDTSLAYFNAAIKAASRKDSGLKRLDSLINYPGTNMTILTPSNEAFKTFISGMVFQSYLSNFPNPTMVDSTNAFAIASQAVAAGPGFLQDTTKVPTIVIKGLIAYHFLATYNPADTAFEPNIRVFSNNFPSNTGVFYTTLINNSAPPSVQPGIMAHATFAGPFVSQLQFTGLGPLGPGRTPYSGGPANAAVSPRTHLVIDNHAVNGVYYVIDKVLLPQ